MPGPGRPKIANVRTFDGVLFDFGHTLFNTKPARVCTADFRKACARDIDEAAFAQTWAAIRERSRQPAEIAKGRDLSAAAHRRLWLELLAPLDELAPDLAEFTYELECSPRGWEPYPDTRLVLSELGRRGIRVGIVSDCGWDIRDVFKEYGLDGFITSYDLSYEHGICKPSAEIFEAACGHLSVGPDQALMVGDNWLADGGAAAIGVMTLILPARDRVSSPALSQVLDLAY
jgi:putative hydrolase of the HAD superfamily